MNHLIFFLLLFLSSTSYAQYPDGTLVFSSKPNTLVGNIAKRMTNNAQYTHIGIIFDNMVYESDWPRVQRTPVSQYGKRKTVNDYYIPSSPFSKDEIDRMKNHATSRLGEPYQLRDYLRKNSRRTTRGTWCSIYVGEVMNQGRYRFSFQQMFEPQKLSNLIAGQYIFTKRVFR